MGSFLGIAAATWGVVMAVAPLLQVRRMVTRRSSDDLSLGYFAVLLPGFALWVGYGWAGADWPLVVPNALALAVGVATVIVGRLLRSHGRPPRQDEATAGARKVSDSD
jgi:uncharacterized protein with PQ loop repeat